MAESLSVSALAENSERNESVEEEEDDSKRPFVFQCSKCREILGDSISWVCSHSERRTVTLKYVTCKLLVCEGLLTSSSGSDIGSTYSVLKCDPCSSVVGKMYRTTPQTLDCLRDLYTLDVDKIEGYQVGLPSLQAAGLPVSEDVMCMKQAKAYVREITKVKSLMIVLNNRICALEKCMQGDLAKMADASGCQSPTTSPPAQLTPAHHAKPESAKKNSQMNSSYGTAQHLDDSATSQQHRGKLSTHATPLQLNDSVNRGGGLKSRNYAPPLQLNDSATSHSGTKSGSHAALDDSVNRGSAQKRSGTELPSSKQQKRKGSFCVSPESKMRKSRKH